MNNQKYKFSKNFITILVYYSCVIILLQFFCIIFLDKQLLSTESALLNWDAEHYHYISQHGYDGFRTAFFPLFPFIWKLTGDGVTIITIINILLFLSAFSWLSLELGINSQIQLIMFASVPTFMFMFLPYTESLFFVFSCFILVGYRRNIPLLLFAGILLSGITRPSATIFIPALICTSMFSYESANRKFKQITLYSITAFAGIAITIFIQHSYTRDWFGFWEAQKGWGNQLRIPKLPLGSWAGGKIVRLDASALLTGLFSLTYIIKIIPQKIKNLSSEIVFALCYIAGISLLILFFRGGSLFSLNRFIYATPFFIVAVLYFIRNFYFSYKQTGLFFILSSAFWLLFGSYVHIQTFLKFELSSVYFSLYFLLNNQNKYIRLSAQYLIVIVNTLLFAYFYYRFLTNEWVG